MIFQVIFAVNNIIPMPKQLIVVMQQNYPFGECQECTNESTRVLVRKIYSSNIQERNKLLEKVSILRKLKNEHMIKIQSVLEQEESIHFLFEYIPIKLQTWISNINDQFIQNFRDQLIKFSSFLANNYIRIEFQLKNIGMDQNYGAKYFLDLNFQMDSSINREKLKSNYIREITNLFKPYIMNASSTPIYPVESERQRTSNDFKASKQISKNTQESRKVHDTSISPPTNKPNNTNNSNNKKNEKALAQYYQEVNMSVDSENQKILQEFMDVLDNEQQEQIKNHPPQVPQPKTIQASSNQFQKPPPHQQVSPPPQLQKNSYQQQATNYQQQAQKPQNNYSSNQNHQQQNPFQQNYPSSARQIAQHQPQPNQYPQFHTQHNLNNIPNSQTVPVRNTNSQMMDKNREMKQAMQAQKFRESADLQNRVKNAIEKSMNVIKKFKAIKDDSIV